MLFCQFAKSLSLRDVSNGLCTATDTLNYFGVNKAPSKSTINFQKSSAAMKFLKTIILSYSID